MLMLSLLIIPLIGIFIIATDIISNNKQLIKYIGLSISIINLAVSLVIFMLFDFSSSQFQFVQDYYEFSGYNIFFGVDGLSIYFVLLTTIITPIAILSNWVSIDSSVKWHINIMLLLETLLLAVFLVLDVLLFYISFESILPPLFLLIGMFGSNNRVRASFYLFLYTLLGSLFLLLSILSMNSIMGTTDYYVLFKMNFNYFTQLFLFYGIFIAFAVKTPTIFLNTWLLKAHVESPLGGSIILAGIVLKLSLYGIFRLILPVLPKASINYTYIIYLIGVISIIYASFSTLRTVDVKELIAYSSVSHAAVYLIGVFSNVLQGIGGGILLGLGHGFVSSGLFICTGGVLYDRSSTRLITYYRGITQLMPLFSIIFFILCLSNAGTPLSLNFVGEFLSLYGTFERLPILGVFTSTSIILSAAYTIYMFNRISFGGKLSMYFKISIPDLNKREFIMLLTLVIFTVILGIYPAIVIDGFNFSISSLIYSFNDNNLYNESYIPEYNINNLQHTIELTNILFYVLILFTLINITAMFAIYSNKIYCTILYVKARLISPKTLLPFIFYAIIFRLILFNIPDDMYDVYVTYIHDRIQSGSILLSSPFDGELPVNDNYESSAGESSNNNPAESKDVCSNESNPGDNPEDDDSNRTSESNENNNNSETSNDNPGDNPQGEVNLEGLAERARQQEAVGLCEHRTFQKQIFRFGPDVEGNVDCDLCGQPVTCDSWICDGCNGVLCDNCDDADFHVANFGDISDEDSATGEDGEAWTEEGERALRRRLNSNDNWGEDSDNDPNQD